MAVIAILGADENADWARAVAADPWTWSGKGREPSDGRGVLSCSGATAVRQKRGCGQCSHPGSRTGPYRRRTGPDCGGFRGSGGNSRAGTRFESHLGHSVSAGQRPFCVDSVHTLASDLIFRGVWGPETAYSVVWGTGSLRRTGYRPVGPLMGFHTRSSFRWLFAFTTSWWLGPLTT